MAIVEKLITADEFARLPNGGRRYELVRGALNEKNMPQPRHGQVCGRIQRLVGNYCDERIGHVLSNDSGVVTERNPDTIRGADVCYYPYTKVPAGPIAPGYLDVVPDVVFEVLSPDDRVMRVLRKTREYLDAGVLAVVVVDPIEEEIQIHRSNTPVEEVPVDGDLKVPEIDANFAISVRRIFA
jgi:Uma2 family endonuclease